MLVNSEDPDQTPHDAVSDLDLHILHMSYKKDAMLVWLKPVTFSRVKCNFKVIQCHNDK